MNRIITRGVAVLAVMAGVAAGYRLGSGHWPTLVATQHAPETAGDASGGSSSDGSGLKHETRKSAPRFGRAERRVLYWKDPDGKPAYSANAAKTADGRDYGPVYDDQEPDFPENKPVAPLKTASGNGKKILFYRNPMGLPDTSPVPKKDWMGMAYIPVYEGEEEEDGTTVKVSLDRVQRSGVRTAIAGMRTIPRPVRAPGVAKPDERTLRVVTLRADGFIETLYVNETGRHVKAGERLFRVFSPDILRAALDTRREAGEGGKALGVLRGEEKLRNFDVPEAAIAEMRRTGHEMRTFDWLAPVSGVVIEKRVIEGQMAKAGDELYRLADLGSIWVIADVAEQDIALVKVGAPAKVNFRAFLDQSFEGSVSFVLHELDAKTRTAKVRIEVKNPEHRIKHEMYADVEIDTGFGDGPTLAVPVSAVIDSGRRQVVIVDRGEGHFEPRQVKLGLKGDGLVEVREGIKVGDKVVVAANFLIDAESNLKAALSGFTADGPQPPAEAGSTNGTAPVAKETMR
jgi:membrane fusion protein, copper/silver efflux system